MVSLLAPDSTLAADLSGERHQSLVLHDSGGTGPAEYFQLSGTSMATPVVSGAAALMLQKNPTLTPDTVKARLMKTAGKTFPVSSTATDPTTGQTYTSSYDVFTIGAGYLDVAACLANYEETQLKQRLTQRALRSHSQQGYFVLPLLQHLEMVGAVVHDRRWGNTVLPKRTTYGTHPERLHNAWGTSSRAGAPASPGAPAVPYRLPVSPGAPAARENRKTGLHRCARTRIPEKPKRALDLCPFTYGRISP